MINCTINIDPEPDEMEIFQVTFESTAAEIFDSHECMFNQGIMVIIAGFILMCPEPSLESFRLQASCSNGMTLVFN